MPCDAPFCLKPRAGVSCFHLSRYENSLAGVELHMTEVPIHAEKMTEMFLFDSEMKERKKMNECRSVWPFFAVL